MTNRPPTMSELLRNKYFRQMMLRPLRLPENLQAPTLSPPFALWRFTTEQTWQRGQYDTYVDAFNAMRKVLKADGTLDVAIVSKRLMLPPPIGFKWDTHTYQWCARCRRPSRFPTRYRHHALKGCEMTQDDSQRCFYCGIRRIALPRWMPR